MNKLTDSSIIKTLASTHKFDYCGIAEAATLSGEAKLLTHWLDKGLQSNLSYMERNADKRIDPRRLELGTKSLIVLAVNYYPGESFQLHTKYKVARYALGDDYHLILKENAKNLIQQLQKNFPGNSFKSYVDSAPIMEKAWAVRAGLGKIGKNGLLIIPGAGSYFSLCIILTDLIVDYDEPITKDICGKCRKCIDSCPVSAIVSPGFIDAGKCIASMTIEQKYTVIENPDIQLHNRIFGCDICQEVCPLNKQAKPSFTENFNPYPFFAEVTDEKWESMTQEEFEKLFRKSPFKRMGYEGIMRNVFRNKMS